MSNDLERFEALARRAPRVTAKEASPPSGVHPFSARNLHPSLPTIVRSLFDNGHYAQATFEAFKFIDVEVQRHSGSAESGYKLMMSALGGNSPPVRLNQLSNPTEVDEQKGFQFLFAGAMLAIRNPRAHTPAMNDDPDLCLDHLGLASMLLRRLADAGYK